MQSSLHSMQVVASTYTQCVCSMACQQMRTTEAQSLTDPFCLLPCVPTRAGMLSHVGIQVVLEAKPGDQRTPRTAEQSGMKIMLIGNIHFIVNTCLCCPDQGLREVQLHIVSVTVGNVYEEA